MQMHCPVCFNQDLPVFLELEGLPVHCNLLWPSREAALTAPRGDMRLGFCHECGMIYNTAFDPSRMAYTQAYENSLHFSPVFQGYAQELATRLIEKYHLCGKDIVEIGCGKGEFLSMLCEGGQNRGFGFDTSYDSDRDGNGAARNITFIRDFYSVAYAEEYPADFICCRQVLEHIQNPREFLLQLRQAIGDRHQTAVFFEVPNVFYTIRDFGIWDILYEHCSYFSPSSFSRLFQETGFAVRYVYPTFGGQFLCLEAFPVDTVSSHATDMATEELGQLSSLISEFGDNYRDKVVTWREDTCQLFKQEKRVVVWGAGTKGVMFLNTLKIDDQVRYVVDINPHKQGMYVAGTGQRIVPPEFLREYQPDIVLLMNPIYRDEIRGMIHQLGVAAEVVAI